MRGSHFVLIPLVAAALAGCLNSDDGSDGSSSGGGFGTQSAPPTGVTFFGDPTATGPSAAHAGYVYTGYRGAEPNIGVTSEGNVFVTAFDKTLRSQDGGQTWQTVQDYDMLMGRLPMGTSDPMLYVDTDTDRIWVNHMWGLNCFNMLWSDDEGETWTQRDLACFKPLVDHQKVASGRPGPGLNPLAGSSPLYRNVVYTCYNDHLLVLGGWTDCFMSYDGGLTYPLQTRAFDFVLDGCGGAAGHPSIAPDGTVALAVGWNCGPLVSVSTNSGLTWTVHPGPTGHGAGASIDPDVSWGPDGEMYLMWRGSDHRTYLARSDDLGASWSETWDVTAPGLTSTRFHVTNAGDSGRIALSYLGTSYEAQEGEAWGGAPHDAPPNATWHLYIVTGENVDTDDPTFTSFQMTPDDDPVQIGCAWEGGGGGGDRRCRNMLDFIDSAVHPDGSFFVVYTEGCTVRSGCAPIAGELPDEMDSRDREIAVAYLSGWSLWDEPRPVPEGRSPPGASFDRDGLDALGASAIIGTA